jgi:hypothetical protein
MLLDHLAADPYLRERFRREAVTAARLVHPGIVAVFDAGVEVLGGPDATPGNMLAADWSQEYEGGADRPWRDRPSTAFIVMELVPGETLRDLIARTGPLSPQLAVGVAWQVADALAYAHAQGLVHRDIKPANVLLRDEGEDTVRVKVADFGIAKAAATGGDLTANGCLLGTPKYISPEQVQGQEPDARADLYSVGVVMFEMLAGRPPFQASSDMATALAHVQQAAPRLDHLRPDLPPGLAELVCALLVKDPDQRVGSALALGGALEVVRKRMGAPAVEAGAHVQLGLRTAPAPGGPDPVFRGTGSSQAQEDSWSGSPSPADNLPVLLGGGRAGAVPPARRDNGTLALPALQVEPVGAGRRSRPGRGRRKPRFTSVTVALLLVAGAVVTIALMQGSGRVPGTSGGAVRGGGAAAGRDYRPLKIVNVSELTQGGDKPNENVGALGNMIGTDPNAFWAGAKYLGPRFAGYNGFGLVFGLAGRHVVHELKVTTPMEGWSAEVFTGDEKYPVVGKWGRVIAEQLDIDGGTTFSLGGRKASFVLLWMLDPGPLARAVVDKVSVR